jgi:type I restriction enzyme S subunit
MGENNVDLWPLPEGWEWRRLGEMVNETEQRSPDRFPDQTFTYVDIASVDNTTGTIVSPKELLGREAPSRARKVIRANDVIFATTRPYLRNIALVPEQYNNQICSTGFCVLRPNRRIIEPVWLYHLCRSDVVLAQIEPLMRGATYPAVTDGDILVATIPVPPLDEQRRIVARVEACFARLAEARRLGEVVRQDTDALIDAALTQAFESGDDLPPGWECKTLTDVGDKTREPVQTGPFGAQLKSSEFVESGVPVLAIGNVQWGYLDASELKYVTPQKAESLARYRVRPGDILFTRMGTVGRSCVVPPEAGGWLISYHLLRIAVQQEICDPRYLSYCLRGARSIGRQIEQVSRGATRAGVNTTILSNLRLPLPSLSEQRHIVAYLDGVQARVAALRRAQAAAAAELARLEESILARAFRGEL